MFPINKNLWTSSFVCQAGGLSLLLLAAFYYVIDVLGYKKWAFFFTVIGMNSILIYMSGRFINWQYANNGFFQWLHQLVGDPWSLFVSALTYLAVRWAFLYYLYKEENFPAGIVPPFHRIPRIISCTGQAYGDQHCAAKSFVVIAAEPLRQVTLIHA